MTPIQDLLHRIRWDPVFGRGEFAIGYYDRIRHDIILVPLGDLTFSRDNPAAFELVDQEGEWHTIPLHRVRSVYRNGELIWHREKDSS